MIDRKQLMIGNYVMIGDRIHVVDEIRTGNIVGRWINTNDGKYSDYKVSMIEEFYPIPLTEEILLKCGFEKELLDPSNPDEGVYYALEFSGEKYCDLSLISCDKNGFLEVGLFPYEEVFRYRYLHQLQNLVHSLTGKELEIKL